MLKAKRMTPYIVDVDFTITDETYYPLIGRSKYNDVYASRSLGDLVRLLEGDGWGQCGKILGNDGQTQLQMF
jgi:hypothetical protein